VKSYTYGAGMVDTTHKHTHIKMYIYYFLAHITYTFHPFPTTRRASALSSTDAFCLFKSRSHSYCFAALIIRIHIHKHVHM
jgi:hypothetical protein